jgi:hypothetical protein
VRNGGEALASTLLALKENRFQDFRLIISDNHSTDGSPWKRQLEGFPPERVVLLQPPVPLGRVEHWTWLAGQAEATYCKLLLCGDLLPPDYLETIAPAFANKPDLIFTPYINVGPGTTMERELGEMKPRKQMTTVLPADYLAQCQKRGNFIGPLSCVTFLTCSLRVSLPFDVSYAWTADWRLYTRIMSRGTAIYCEGTYCIQDRRIARLSSSFRGSLNGIYETNQYSRNLKGKGPASKLEGFAENFRPVVGLILRSYLPTSLYRIITLQRSRRI